MVVCGGGNFENVDSVLQHSANVNDVVKLVKNNSRICLIVKFNLFLLSRLNARRVSNTLAFPANNTIYDISIYIYVAVGFNAI